MLVVSIANEKLKCLQNNIVQYELDKISLDVEFNLLISDVRIYSQKILL